MMVKVKMKKPDKGVFLSNLGNRSLTLWRTADRIKEIQGSDPSFNYRDNARLQTNIDSMIKALEHLKTIGIK